MFRLLDKQNDGHIDVIDWLDIVSVLNVKLVARAEIPQWDADTQWKRMKAMCRCEYILARCIHTPRCAQAGPSRGVCRRIHRVDTGYPGVVFWPHSTHFPRCSHVVESKYWPMFITSSVLAYSVLFCVYWRTIPSNVRNPFATGIPCSSAAY